MSSLLSLFFPSRRCICRCRYATCAESGGHKKQTIRFYCFLACEEIRAVAGYSAASTAADAATAATAANATSIAAGRKQQAGGSRKSRRSCHCKQGRCTTCQNEQLLCKNVAELT